MSETPAAPFLAILNGPPASGKTTLARFWCERFEQALHIDVDEIRETIASWRDEPFESGTLARTMVRSMAKCHLANGKSVVISQLYGHDKDLDLLQLVAEGAGARYVELVLMVDRDIAFERFLDRGGNKVDALGHDGMDTIKLEFDVLYDRVRDGPAKRGAATIVNSIDGNIDRSLQAVLEASGLD